MVGGDDTCVFWQVLLANWKCTTKILSQMILVFSANSGS